MVDLPEDVWELVTQYLPRSERLALVSVNRPLFNIVLNERYRKIEWVDLDAQMLKHLARLGHPYVASRVRCLHIRSWFMKGLLAEEPTSESQSTCTQMILSRLAVTLKPQTPPDPLQEQSIGKPFVLSKLRQSSAGWSKDILNGITAAFSLMVNVKEFVVEWRDLPLSHDAKALLTSSRTAFNSSLCKLVLHASISRLGIILTIMKFDSLQELEIQFDFDAPEARLRKRNEAILAKTIAPFISDLGPSLRFLMISSSADADLVHFFQNLGPLPVLRSLSIRVSFEKEHLSDPAGINEILRSHAFKLLNVEIVPTRTSNSYLDVTWPALIRTFISDTTWLANVESLTIASLNYVSTLSLLGRVANTLTKLRLVQHYMTHDEIAQLLPLFRNRTFDLKYLSIEVKVITPALISLLANGLPGLFSLTLVFEDYHGTREALGFGVTDQLANPVDWNLFDLSIFIKAFRDDSILNIPVFQRDEDLLMAFVLLSMLHSVRSFKGRGHTMLL